jgi:hypothetical protein
VPKVPKDVVVSLRLLLCLQSVCADHCAAAVLKSARYEAVRST